MNVAGWRTGNRQKIIEPEEMQLCYLLLPNQDQLKWETEEKSMSFAIIRPDYYQIVDRIDQIKENFNESFHLTNVV